MKGAAGQVRSLRKGHTGHHGETSDSQGECRDVQSIGREESACVHGAAAGVAGGLPLQAVRGHTLREHHS